MKVLNTIPMHLVTPQKRNNEMLETPTLRVEEDKMGHRETNPIAIKTETVGPITIPVNEFTAQQSVAWRNS